MLKIVMLSGGLESTCLLFRELKELKTEDSLFVYHVSLINSENRFKAEAIAVKKIVEFARKYGDFVFNKSAVEYNDVLGSGYCGIDIHSLAFMAGHFAKHIAVAFGTLNLEVLLGACVEEENPEDFFDDYRYKIFLEFFRTHFLQEKDRGLQIPKIHFPYIYEGIREQIKFVPEEVKQFVISCRRPVEIGETFTRCGFCYTCQKIQKLKLEGIL